MSLLRAAFRPLGATKADCSRGEASAQTPGLRALQPHVEPSSARPPLQGSRARVSLGAGLPCIWARGLTSTQMRPALSTQVPNLPLHRAPPEPGCGDPNTPITSIREQAPAHWDRATHRKTCTRKHGPVRAHSGRRTGDFVKCIISSPFRSGLGSGFGLLVFHLNACVSVEGETADLDKVSAVPD